MISTKSIFLLAMGIAILSLFFLLPLNQDWMNRRLKGYWKDFTNQATRMKPEQRKVSRYGNAYVYSKQISNYFLQKNIHDRVLVLMPPESYFKKYGLHFPVPEPAVFYYYSGLKTVWPRSSDANKANYCVGMRSGLMVIDSLPDQKSLMDSIAVFKKYPSGL